MEEEEARRRYEQFLGKLRKLESLSEDSRWLTELTGSIYFQDADNLVDMLLEENFPDHSINKKRGKHDRH
jgi:hypothetical protein